MKKYGETFLSEDSDCSYLPDRLSRFENFLALELSLEETDFVLAQGWRKFGPHFFRPQCENCRACVPLRVLVNQFKPTKSQARIIKKSSEIRSEFKELNYRPEYFDLYQRHSKVQFGNIPITSEREFLEAFFIPSAPAIIHEISYQNQLVGLGFCDVGASSLSSVYFCYDPDFKFLSLGTLSAINEIEWARARGLNHYYLGYFIAENRSMNYKARFSPHELYDWYNEVWNLSTKDL